ncbi:hypothetical protein KUTeg_005484 [Tegillarca granosa]|uniref:Leucyl aminopeptidase n=1 Tax=Tegillarca granosa TaxID=220873 RepID=A0ABQ9FPD1_TEGGR|nr:hypothetical protein KUTeg_005484 [Tegillarca granosa]
MTMADVRVPTLVPCLDVKDKQFDGVVVVTDKVSKLTGNLECLKSPLELYSKVDNSLEKDVVFLVTDVVPSKRLIFAATGPLNRDQDDVRRFADAAEKGIKRALKAGCKAPLLVRPVDDSFEKAGSVSLLAALHALYVPLEIREAVKEKAVKAEKLGVWCNDENRVKDGILLANALEAGRIVARDIGGSDPERMAAPRVAEYVQNVLKDTGIKITVVSDPAVLKSDFPLLAAVNRAASVVDRHRARLMFLEYEGEWKN